MYSSSRISVPRLDVHLGLSPHGRGVRKALFKEGRCSQNALRLSYKNFRSESKKKLKLHAHLNHPLGVEQNNRRRNSQRVSTSYAWTHDGSALSMRQMVERWCESFSLFELSSALLQTNFSYHTYFQRQFRFLRRSGIISGSSVSAKFLRFETYCKFIPCKDLRWIFTKVRDDFGILRYLVKLAALVCNSNYIFVRISI